MKCSFGVSNFLEEISSLSHSVLFLYFFALIPEEGFLISPCYSLELCIQMGISFLFSFALASLLFTAICKASSDSHFSFLHFFFLGMVLIPVSCTMSHTSIHSSWRFLHGFVIHLFLFLSNIPLYGCTTLCLSIHLLKGTLVASKLCQLWIKPLHSFMCMVLCGHKLTVHLGKCQEHNHWSMW